MIGLFKQFSLEQVLFAIRNNVDLWNSKWGDREQLRQTFMMLGRDPRFRRHLPLFTTKNVLVMLSEQDALPTYASLIVNTPGGLGWLEFQVMTIKKAILNFITEP